MADPPQKVVVDGEIIGTTPVEIECIPSGLTVFAPTAIANEIASIEGNSEQNVDRIVD
jgi:diacylglycerol kinase family enzyme